MFSFNAVNIDFFFFIVHQSISPGNQSWTDRLSVQVCTSEKQEVVIYGCTFFQLSHVDVNAAAPPPLSDDDMYLSGGA